ncbi:MAG: STAS domain-containing protein [Spirochaetia bacterium]|jgi:anti-anti-sigma factor
MNISVRFVENAYIVDVAGNVNASNAHELKDTVSDAIEKKIAACILNMRKATSLDSCGIGMLISVSAMLTRNGIVFRIVNIPRHILQILECTRAIAILPTAHTILEAFSSLGMESRRARLLDTETFRAMIGV